MCRVLTVLFQAAARAFPNFEQSPYTEVIALLLYWEEDDLQVRNEIDALTEGFPRLLWLRGGVLRDTFKRAPNSTYGRGARFCEILQTE
jgi:hypothetical protein